VKNTPLIIAEAGVNHNGEISKAFKLVDLAKKSGAHYVKFQIFKTEALVTKNIGLANYQKKNLNKKILSQFDMLNKYSLSYEKFDKIIKYCSKKKIKFLATPFDPDSLQYLLKKKLDFIKIGSGDIDNFELLNELSKHKIKIILSTGVSNLNEIKKTSNFFKKKKFKIRNIHILHCTSNYPAPLDSVNLNFINTLLKTFKVKIGYSDHTESLLTGAIAVSLGASIIEKHITLDKNMSGPDHKASMNFIEFKKYVKNIKETVKILGSNNKKVGDLELSTKKVIQRFIVAKNNIRKGEKFTYKNITCKRARKGISANNWFNILGRKSKRNFRINDIIST